MAAISLAPPRHGPDFLAGGGDMGARMRAFDWASHPLGTPARWPQALRTVVRLMLTTNHPVFIFWGEEHFCFYNDAYSASLGPEKHPAMLGARGRAMWDEIWHIIGPQIDQVMAGEGATWHEDHLVPIVRHGAVQEVYWTYSYSPIDHRDGVGGVLVLCNETTRRVVAERERELRFRQFTDALRQAPGLASVTEGPEHRYVFVNDAAKRFLGRGDLIGMTVREAVPEIEGQGIYELLDRVYATGEPFVGAAVPMQVARVAGAAPEEAWLDLVYQPIRDAAGNVTGIFIEGFDVTDRVRAEEALRVSHARAQTSSDELQAIYDQAPVGMGQLDGDLRFVRINDQLAAMNGIPAAAHIGKSIHEIVPDLAPKVEADFRRILETGEPMLNVELVGQTAADPGVEHTWLESWHALRDPRGAITGIVAIAQDITERKRADEHRELLVNELNHRVKNTLATVQAITAQTFRDDRADKSARDSFDARLHALARAHDVLTRANWESVDVRGIVSLAAAPYAAERFSLAGSEVRIGPEQALSLAMTLHELATNAAKYGALSAPEGRVEVFWETGAEAGNETLRMQWREAGGPPVTAPQRTGFGARLIRRGVSGGRVTLAFEPAGVVWDMTMVLD